MCQVVKQASPRDTSIPALFISKSSAAIAVKPMIISLCVLLFKVKGYRTEPFVYNLGSSGAAASKRERYQKQLQRQNPLHWLSSVGVRNGFGRHTDWCTLYLEKYGNIKQGPLCAGWWRAFLLCSWKCPRCCLPQIVRWERKVATRCKQIVNRCSRCGRRFLRTRHRRKRARD